MSSGLHKFKLNLNNLSDSVYYDYNKPCNVLIKELRVRDHIQFSDHYPQFFTASDYMNMLTGKVINPRI